MILDDAHAVSEIQKYVQGSIDDETLAHVSIVGHRFYLCTLLLADHLFDIGYVSVLYR